MSSYVIYIYPVSDCESKVEDNPDFRSKTECGGNLSNAMWNPPVASLTVFALVCGGYLTENVAERPDSVSTL
jgi:hypothetical protein